MDSLEVSMQPAGAAVERDAKQGEAAHVRQPDSLDKRT
jgi:hypothetical protein